MTMPAPLELPDRDAAVAVTGALLAPRRRGFSFRANRFMLTLGVQSRGEFRMRKHALIYEAR